jgi:hypothetical protein
MDKFEEKAEKRLQSIDAELRSLVGQVGALAGSLKK